MSTHYVKSSEYYNEYIELTSLMKLCYYIMCHFAVTEAIHLSLTETITELSIMSLRLLKVTPTVAN